MRHKLLRYCHRHYSFPSNKFNRLTDGDVRYFRSIVDGPNDVVESAEDLIKYNIDWTKKYQGSARLALRPSTTEQISEILKYCNDSRLAVVPQGGNTGLVGGGIPVFDEIILLTEKLNKIYGHDSNDGVISLEAGCILEMVENYLLDRGFIMPLDLGAKGSCTIGGNIATNAGGLRLLRYGNLHGNVLGLRIVLADGTILDDMNTCRKNNTGYDLKQLFIGSEGTLGIITAATLLTPMAPQSTNVLLLAVKEYEHIGQIFVRTKMQLGEILSAFEFWDNNSQRIVDKHHPTGNIIPKGDFYILIETQGSNYDHDRSKILSLLEDLQTTHLVVDGIMAQDEIQLKSLWSLRENIPEACSREGKVLKYDISLRNSEMYSPVKSLKERLGSTAKEVVGYGHFGDGNIHLNIICDPADSTAATKIEPFIYEFIQKRRGSISAEHGIGIMKAKYLSFARSVQEINLMRKIKLVLDPKGILNPLKVLPPS